MKIHGFQKTTLLDYPGYVAATVFTGGCNFRCPFCQNGSLVTAPERQPVIPEEEVLAHLRKRRRLLEGVCITGGEPTLERELKGFILRCRELGYRVKLDTNGYRPEALEEFLREGLLDYVAMDIKASPENYGRATGCPGCDMERIRESIRLLRTGGIPFEFRTTVVKGIHSVEEFEEIGRLLAGSPVYYLQAYRESGDILGMGEEIPCGQDDACTGRKREQKTVLSDQRPERMMTLSNQKSEQKTVLSDQRPERMMTLSNRKPEQKTALSDQRPERMMTLSNQKSEQMTALSDQRPERMMTLSNQEPEQKTALSGQQPGQMAAFSRQEMERMAALAGKYIDKVELRGVE